MAAVDVEAVTRPLLEAFAELTGLSSTYLTMIAADRSTQRVMFAHNVGSLIIPEDLEVAWADTLCRRALESGQVCTTEAPALWPDSDAARALLIQTYVSAAVTGADGTLIGTLCGGSRDRVTLTEHDLRLLRTFSAIVGDALERERDRLAAEDRAAHAEQRLRERAEFLAAAEHQLKTRLTVVAGWTRTLDRVLLDSSRREQALRELRAGVESLTSDVERVVAEAAATSLATQVDLRATRLDDVLHEVVQQFGALSAQHQLEVAPGSDVVATADPRALRIIVEHLVENAVKYSRDGGRIVVGAALRPGGAELWVRDHGPGLPAGVDIFEPFTRGDRTAPGSGLGLHVVRSLARSIGGEVSAHDTGAGAEFRIRLRTPKVMAHQPAA